MDINKIISILKEHVKEYGFPAIEQIESQTHDPFQVLVGTILSARTKDEVTAKAGDKLFAEVKTPADLERLPLKEIEKLIYPVGFYKTKAKHLKQLPHALQQFDGKIPETIEELTKLPGVGRKTANLVVALAFKKPAICVDTHVHHIMNRIGYVKTKNPFETEMALREKLPKKHWTTINFLLVLFGQNLCKPISPFCSKCPITEQCQKIRVTTWR